MCNIFFLFNQIFRLMQMMILWLVCQVIPQSAFGIEEQEISEVIYTVIMFIHKKYYFLLSTLPVLMFGVGDFWL